VTHSPGHRRPGVPARASRSLLADRPALDSARATVPRARGRLPAGRDQRAEAGDWVAVQHGPALVLSAWTWTSRR